MKISELIAKLDEIRENGRKRTIGLSTNFKLEQFYEIGDLTIYENTRFTMSERDTMICFDNRDKMTRLRVKGDLLPEDFLKCWGSETDKEYLAASMVSKLIGLGFETSIVFDNNTVTSHLGWAYRFHQDGKITAIFVGAEGGLNTPVDREAFKKWAKERQYSKWVRKLIRITWADGSKSRVFVFGFEDNHLKGYAVDALLGYTAHHNHFATSKIASIEEIL